MSTPLSLSDLFAAQSCPEQAYFDLLVDLLRSRGASEEELSAFTFQGQHPTRAISSDYPLSDEARELYRVVTGNPLVTWTEAVRWVEEQGRTEENILFNQLYSFAWVRPAPPLMPVKRFNPQTRGMEVHDNLYDLSDVAKLLYPSRRRAMADSLAIDAVEGGETTPLD